MITSHKELTLGQRVCFRKHLIITGFVLLSFIIFTPSAFAISLGTAGQYNAFIFGNFTASNSDIEGRLAVGGNASLTNYTVGSNLPENKSGKNNSLVVGGDLTYKNGEIQKGNAVVGGSSKGENVKDGKLSAGLKNLPLDFTAEKKYLTGLSSQLASYKATGKVVNNYGAIKLTTDSNSMMQVFDIDGLTLSNANSFSFVENDNTPENASFVFNISGNYSSMNNMGMQSFVDALGSSYDNVLFNFYQAESLEFSGISIKGSILAPLASVTANNGNIEGTIIAESWEGGMELHNVLFDGTDRTNPVPEPGTIVLLSSGLLSLAEIGRRQKWSR